MVPMSHARILSERIGRIELPPSAWKAEALPLCNIRNAHFYLLPTRVVWATPLAPPPGIEPGTLELTALCSASELKGNTIQLYLSQALIATLFSAIFLKLLLVNKMLQHSFLQMRS